MRRKKEEITNTEHITRILRTAHVGRLATNGSDGYPYITPVNFVYWCDSVYFHCARQGEKLDNIARDPRVCFTVDLPLAYIDTGFAPDKPPCEVGQLYQCVIIRGRAELVRDQAEKLGALNALMGSHEQVENYQGIRADARAVELCEVVAVRVERISAKANLAQKRDAVGKANLRRYLQARKRPGDEESSALI
jgi:nitroimidazol reductase NimA-like FMN-containing flavoprotein (pyridoxamine 5'-phosphate oxidase superfamily)